MSLRRRLARRRRLLLGCLSVAAFVAAWEVAFSTVVRWDPFFITKPSLIAAAFREQILGGKLWHDMAVSAADVSRIRAEHPESDGWRAVGITHPLWMTA